MNLTEKRFIELMRKKFNKFNKYFDDIFKLSFHFKLENGNNINIYFEKNSYVNCIENCNISFYNRKNGTLKNILQNETNINIIEKKINEIINENTLQITTRI